MRHGDLRIPWWAIFVPADRVVLDEALSKLIDRTASPPDPEDIEVASADGWSGVVSYRREEPNWEMADVARDLFGDQVLVMEWGHAPGISRWNGSSSQWTRTEEDIAAATKRLSIRWPWPKTPPGRPYRYAALLAGANADDVRHEARDPRNVLETPRGPVLFAEEGTALAFGESPGVTTFGVTRFLDDGEFSVSVFRDGEAAVYGGSYEHTKRILDIEGETEPKAILRRLCIPEDYIFPDSAN